MEERQFFSLIHYLYNKIQYKLIALVGIFLFYNYLHQNLQMRNRPSYLQANIDPRIRQAGQENMSSVSVFSSNNMIFDFLVQIHFEEKASTIVKSYKGSLNLAKSQPHPIFQRKLRTLTQLQQHMANPKNYIIRKRQQNMFLQILDESKEIAQIKLIYEQTRFEKISNNYFSPIYKNCLKREELTSDDLKSMIEKITLAIETLAENIKEKNREEKVLEKKIEEKLRILRQQNITQIQKNVKIALQQSTSFINSQSLKLSNIFKAQLSAAKQLVSNIQRIQKQYKEEFKAFVSEIKVYPQKKINPPIKQVSFVDTESADFKKLIIDQNKILAQQNSAIFGSQPIKGKFNFSLAISELKNEIGIGIIDKRLKSSQNFSKDQQNWQNWITYQNDGWLWNGIESKYCGRGYKRGEKIEIEVNMFEGTITWKIGTQQIKQTVDKIRKKDVEWVPFIGLDRNSSIFF